MLLSGTPRLGESRATYADDGSRRMAPFGRCCYRSDRIGSASMHTKVPSDGLVELGPECHGCLHVFTMSVAPNRVCSDRAKPAAGGHTCKRTLVL